MEESKQKIRILHVEDDKTHREHLKLLLGRLSFDCDSAHDGIEGLSKLKQNNYDIVITDVLMPKLNGIEMARKMKKLRNDVRIVVYSCLEKRQYLKDAINIGVEAYIEKSFANTDELIGSLNTIAEKISLERRISYQKEKISQLFAAIEQNANFVVLADKDRVIEYANPVFFRTTGYSSDEVIGRKLEDFKDKTYLEAIDKSDLGQFSNEEFILKCKGDKHLYIRCSLSLIKEEKENPSFWVETSTDITEAKQKENKLLEAKEIAESASKSKDTFIANMNHELRTPLNGIIGMSALMLDTKLTPKQDEYLRMIKNSGDALLNVINNILDYSKIESGSRSVDSIAFDLHDLVEQSVDFFGLAAHAKNIKLQYNISSDLPRFLIGDNRKIQQVLTNVVGNSIKFTDNGTVDINIQCDAVLGNNAELVFHIKDSGIGIPQDKIENLFDSFTQADPSFTRKHGGVGLGLTISKNLIEMMGGKIWINSREKYGTDLYFRLKLGIDKEREAKFKKQAPVKVKKIISKGLFSGKVNILLAEDNIMNQRLIIEFLKTIDYSVQTALNGEEAVELYKKNNFDLVLMDIEMPQMNGFDASRNIRKLEGKSQDYTPIIALTAHTTDRAREECFQSGMDAFLIKPIDFDNLIRTIDKFLSQNLEKKVGEPSIDLTHLVEIFGNNADLMHKLFEDFLQDFPKEIEQMKSEYGKGRYKESKFYIGKMSSALGTFGAKKARLICQDLELAFASENKRDIDKLIKEFEQESTLIIRNLNDFLEKRLNN
jgi:PAS domain S-box-containing protein